MFKKKTWENRVTEYPNRRRLTPVPGTQNTYDVTRAEGAVTHSGQAFDAANLNDLEKRISDAFADLVDYLMPVGHLYTTLDPGDNPNKRYTGTKWQLISAGLALRQAGDGHAIGMTFGEATHTLTVDELPSHNHGIQLSGDELPGESVIEWTYKQNARVYNGTDLLRQSGGGQPHNNIGPSLACNIWQRIA